MADYELSNGYIPTDDEIERRAKEWDEGTWNGHLVTIRAGRPLLSDELNVSMSFKCPESGAKLIARAAQISGVKKSVFMSDAAIEKATHVLSIVEQGTSR